MVVKTGLDQPIRLENRQTSPSTVHTAEVFSLPVSTAYLAQVKITFIAVARKSQKQLEAFNKINERNTEGRSYIEQAKVLLLVLGWPFIVIINGRPSDFF